MPLPADTIAAIATASGPGGIAVIRISGPESIPIAQALVSLRRPLSSCAGGTFHYGKLYGSCADSRGWGDDVVVLLFRTPHSYTREDVVEIQAHGGRVNADRVLQAVLRAGARAAEPGEFTKRAFLNGRIDLMQAEAVADLIQARSARAATAAAEQLDGRLSRQFQLQYTALLECTADLEAFLDFSEDELPEYAPTDLLQRLQSIASDLHALQHGAQEGHILRDGALVAICGEPNVGKSTLMNKLLGKNRAIVSHTPGTTRDSIEEHFILDGYPLRLVDTAGLRQTECQIEQKGIERTKSIMEQADLLIYVGDASRPQTAEEAAWLHTLPQDKRMVLLNKKDLGIARSATQEPALICSLFDDHDLNAIRHRILEKLALDRSSEPHAVISSRHFHLIQSALNDLNEACGMLQQQREDLWVPAAQRLRAAAAALGAITGRCCNTDLLDHVFSRFCIGK